jgi:hypothetical protein
VVEKNRILARRATERDHGIEVLGALRCEPVTNGRFVSKILENLFELIGLLKIDCT